MRHNSLKNKKIKNGGKRTQKATKKHFIPTFLSLQCLLVLYFYLRYYKDNSLRDQDLSNQLILDKYQQNFKSITHISEAISILDQCQKNIDIFHKLFLNNQLSSSKFYHLILLDLKNLNKIVKLISRQNNIDEQFSFNIQDLSSIIKDYQKICQLLNLSLNQMNKIKLEIDICQKNVNSLLDQNPDILKKKKLTKNYNFLGNFISPKDNGRSPSIAFSQLNSRPYINNPHNKNNEDDKNDKNDKNKFDNKFIFNQYITSKLREIDQNLSFFMAEAGGGGDCLFHSIALGLKQYNQMVPTNQIKNFDYIQLRKLVGKHIREMKESEYNDMMETLQAAYNANIWYDAFNPLKIKSKEQLSTEYERLGNYHWGNQQDICFLQKELQIKIILVDKNKTDIFWSIDKSDYKYIMLINYIQEYHYQLGGIKLNDESTILSVFKSSDLIIKKILKFFNLLK